MRSFLVNESTLFHENKGYASALRKFSTDVEKNLSKERKFTNKRKMNNKTLAQEGERGKNLYELICYFIFIFLRNKHKGIEHQTTHIQRRENEHKYTPQILLKSHSNL